MILMLNSSPRKTGVTSSLLRIVADEARSAGAEVEWVDVNSLSIRPCIGCLKCRPDKKCILPKDDAHRIGELLERCSALVVATPTYWGNMPGPLKLLFDRNVPVLEYYELYTWRFPRPRHKGKPAAIITASLSPFPFNYLPSQGSGAIRAVKLVLNAAGFDVRRQINVPMTRNVAHIGERWLAKAGRLGKKMGSW
ncbi:MAG TPA: flavodoxin family protein [Nitrospirota bacterium]|nr:flavodoxin family protein [Nitrospirota bacterium]